MFIAEKEHMPCITFLREIYFHIIKYYLIYLYNIYTIIIINFLFIIHYSSKKKFASNKFYPQ